MDSILHPPIPIPPPPMSIRIAVPDQPPVPFAVAVHREPEFPQLLDIIINEGHITDRRISVPESLTPREDTFFHEMVWF
jgi:hypothetical protein